MFLFSIIHIGKIVISDHQQLNVLWDEWQFNVDISFSCQQSFQKRKKENNTAHTVLSCCKTVGHVD